jgi:TM2 domain-containing membrane protein YozV
MNLNPNPQAEPQDPHYVRPRDYYRDPRLKSHVVAGLLSLMPGLGQAYLGFTRLAFIHGLTAATFVALMSTNKLGDFTPFVGILMFFFWLYNLVDAHRRALLVNDLILRAEQPELPDGLGQLSSGAQVGFGLAFLAFGSMSLLSTRFGISFAWLLKWWPAAFILLGLWLVLKAIRDRAPKA